MSVHSDSMLMAQQTSGPPDLMAAIEQFGFGTDLKFCLDAGDSASFSGTGQVWSDLSGNATNFLRGNTSSAGSDDPTFNGVAGRKSAAEYWSFDGGDWFNLNGANPAWANTLHKKGAKFSFCGWFYFVNTASKTLFMTRRSTSDHGFSVSGGDDLRFFASAAGGNICDLSTAADGMLLPLNTWSFVAASIDEAGGADASFLMINNDVALKNGAYSASSGSNASYTLRMAGNGGSVYIASGSRLASAAVWQNRCLTPAEMRKIYTATSQKFK